MSNCRMLAHVTLVIPPLRGAYISKYVIMKRKGEESKSRSDLLYMSYGTKSSRDQSDQCGVANQIQMIVLIDPTIVTAEYNIQHIHSIFRTETII